MDKYVERLQTLSDDDLKREWKEETGERWQQIEHEMARRFQNPMLKDSYLLDKFMKLPEQFMTAYQNKDWFMAKYIYDQAIVVGLFMEIPVEVRNEVFGITREDEEESIEGLIPRNLVSKVYLECAVKDNLGHECIVYRVPGEMGFYGAKHWPGINRRMSAEENPSYRIRDQAV